LDADLAELYGVEVRSLNQAVRRNLDRFPEDFAFQLTWKEADALRSQDVILERGRGRHRKYRPLAFSEQGVAMLSSVLRSPRAIAVNIEIMRAFVKLRHLLESNSELSNRLDELERQVDSSFQEVFEAIRQLMSPPADAGPRRIGFLKPATQKPSPP
jgi:hypothetical protein